MWERKCQAKTKRGQDCSRRAGNQVWCFEFQGESFDSATWVETCGHHITEASRIVTWATW